MPVFSPFILAALRAARAAGEIQRGLLGHPGRIEYKSRNNPVTEADRASEEAIVQILREAFPDHAFLGEEGGRRGEGEHTWLIDPLDGTYNYAHAIPWFAVSIALEHRSRLIAGVILHPVLKEVYAAERGRGAFAAGTADLPPDAADWGDLSLWRPIAVSGTRRLDEATLSTGFPPSVAETRINLDHFTNLLISSAKIRNMGSAALSLAAVALGQMEGYWEVGPHAWDLAAGSLLVEEAGGRISDLRGRPVTAYGRQILATNGGIHDQVVAVLARGRSGLSPQG
jgi:myo-inositol-1(or 4)-monophosphatase